ncbi:hypothetical protein MBLNU457_4092t1 [Dothideomycetes sp. NU457]
MPSGSCFCGQCAYEFSGEPAATALCHCRDCQKIGGSTYSTNIIVSGDGFKVTKGNTKTYSKKADSGNTITTHFCPDCGSSMFREGETFGSSKVIKVGTLDSPSAFQDYKPQVELYTPERVSWVSEINGAAQKSGMP